MKSSLITIFLSYITSFAMKRGWGSPGEHFKYRVDPSRDLELITSSEASCISKGWINNILENQEPLSDDDPVMNDINRFEQYVQDHRDYKDMYFIWKPMTFSGRSATLFIVCCDTNSLTNCLNVQYLIQSPWWTPERISSKHLKNALDYKGVSSYKNTFYGELKEHQPRHYMSWFFSCL